MRYLPCPFSCSSHTHAHASVTFVFPNHFFLSFSFVMLWDRFVQIRRKGGGGVRIRIWQADVTTWLFFKDALHCASKLSFYFFSLILVLSFVFVYFLLLRTVCACAPFPSTNKCLPHSYDFDGHGTSRNE